MPNQPLTPRVLAQISKAQLPMSGPIPFVPAIGEDSRGRECLLRAPVLYGPKQGKIGYLDTQGRIWIRDYAHAGLPDHWDVQENGGVTYFRVNYSGSPIS